MEHRLELPDGFCLNYTNVTRDKIGPLGLAVDELAGRPEIGAAMDALAVMRRSGDVRGHDEKVYFTRLAYQEGDAPDRLRAIARIVRCPIRPRLLFGLLVLRCAVSDC